MYCFFGHILSLSEIILEPGTDLTEVLIGYFEVTSEVLWEVPHRCHIPDYYLMYVFFVHMT